MSETKDCICGTKDFSKLIANFKFVHCCQGNRSRKNQTAKMVVLKMFWGIFFEIDVFSSNLWCFLVK